MSIAGGGNVVSYEITTLQKPKKLNEIYMVVPFKHNSVLL